MSHRLLRSRRAGEMPAVPRATGRPSAMATWSCNSSEAKLLVRISRAFLHLDMDFRQLLASYPSEQQAFHAFAAIDGPFAPRDPS